MREVITIPRMTKAQSRKRLNEAWKKISTVLVNNMDKLPKTMAKDYDAIGRIIDKWDKSLK